MSFISVYLYAKPKLPEAGFQAGAGLHFRIYSAQPFNLDEKTLLSFSIHLPGFTEAFNPVAADSQLTIEIKKNGSGQPISITQQENRVVISAPWQDTYPDDFAHLLNGLSRINWLNRGVYPVHSVCIGDDVYGYYLLVGTSGAGKTSQMLHSILHHDRLIFSTDKTLVRFSGDTGLEALSGTPTITVRDEDKWRWPILAKQPNYSYWGRQVFKLDSSHYSKHQTVPIRGIFLIRLSKDNQTSRSLSHLSALHTLYPFFLDREREDVLIGGSDALLDGSVSRDVRHKLAKNLEHLLQVLPVFQVTGSPEYIDQFIGQKLGLPHSESVSCSQGSDRRIKKVLVGICGLGYGHVHRQAMVIRHLLAQGHQVTVFTYGNGLTYFQQHAEEFINVSIIPTANPYLPGIRNGLDFAASATHPLNRVDFHKINALAMDRANQLISAPDLVISDYEMVSAQYAYAKQSPLVTFDHQSLYLISDLPESLNGFYYKDEIERLNLFFPKVKKRIITAFYSLPLKPDVGTGDVELAPPLIRPEILKAKGTLKSKMPSLLVYISSQQKNRQAITDWIHTIQQQLPSTMTAHIFLPRGVALPDNTQQLYFYQSGSPEFDQLLLEAHGIISTAGNTLLSEAMYLEKPVYAVPLPLHEQQLNAAMIEQGGFGLANQEITDQGIQTFIRHLPDYELAIKNDQTFLMQQSDEKSALRTIDQFLEDCVPSR